MIKLENIDFYYKKTQIFDKFNLEIEKGNITCLIGENGAGKSTLIKLISGLLYPKRGKLTIDNLEYANSNDLIRNKLFATVNEPVFYGHLTVYENLDIFCKYKGISNNEIESVLEILNIDGKKKVKELSTGMKQKLSLAYPLLYDYKIIILDEPLANIDPFGIELILKLLKKLNEEKGCNILISTHLLGEFGEFFDEFLVLKSGKLLFQGKQDSDYPSFKSKLLNVHQGIL